MARSIWSGSISFGIVNIPIQIYTAVKDHGIHFHQVSQKQKKRIRYMKVAEGSDKEVPQNDIVKGFEVDKGQYVLIDDKEFEKLAAAKSRSIDILDFVKLDEIDPLFFDQPYYIVPDEKAGRSYWLLVDALEQSGKVAIAQFVMRSKEYLGAIRPLNNVLCLETMRYNDEIVDVKEIGEEIAKHDKARDRELKIATQLIDSMTTTWKPENYQDDYRKRVQQFIDKKAKGEGLEILDEPWGDEVGKKPAKVLDLMAALEESLNRTKKKMAEGGSEKSGEKTHGPHGHSRGSHRGPGRKRAS